MLLTLAAAGLALLFYLVLQGTPASRAAMTKRIKTAGPSPSEAVAPRSESVTLAPVVLAQPTTPAPEPVAKADDTTLLVAGAPTGVSEPEKARFEGPKMKTVPGHGKAGKIEPGALRAEQRERRKARLEAEAEQARAMGTEPVETQPIEAVPNPNRARLEQKGLKSDKNGQRKPKKKSEPKEG